MSDTDATTVNEDLLEKATDAYVFTYGLVLNYRTMYLQAIKGDGEFGKYLNLGLGTPEDTDIVTPNNDTPYSYVWLDLRAEPWVLTLPPVEAERYYVSQWDDMWGFVMDSPGSLEDGSDGVTIMIAAPDWEGKKPEGVARVVKGETSVVGSITRIQYLEELGGIERVQEIQGELNVRPLHQYLGEAAPAAAPAIDWPEWQEGAQFDHRYWDYAAFMLQFATPMPVDKPMYDALAALGIEAGKPFDQSKLSADVQQALVAGPKAGQQRLTDTFQVAHSSASIFGPRDVLFNNYLSRALGVFAGILGNVAGQAIYLSIPLDSDGEPLNGSNTYTMTFEKGQTPPVQYFWSITMYDLPERLLVANSLDRYELGSRTEGMKTNSDGSLTITFAATDPGGDLTSNWLPAPEGPFWLVLRLYGPETDLLDGAWQRPPVLKQA